MCGDAPDEEPYCQWYCKPRRICKCEKGKPERTLAAGSRKGDLMTRSRYAGFDATNPFHKTTYICDICGKRTRETGHSESGVGLCAKCLEECELENEHSDYGGHSIGRNADGSPIISKAYNLKCPVCQYMRERGEI